MAIHWGDIDGRETTAFYPGYEIGYDVALELWDKYPSKSLLIDRALRLGYYVGTEAERGRNMGDFKKDFYTVPEAAELLRVHENTVYNMCRQRKIEYYKVGAQIRISAAELEKLKVERADKNNAK